MKSLSSLISTHGIRQLARDLKVNEATVWKWCDKNRAPRWRIEPLRQLLGQFSMSKK